MRQRGAAVRQVSTQRPSSGMVEHDPDELLAGTLAAISEVVAEVGARVAGIGIASQTESFVLWERSSGRAVTPAMSWQDRRAAELCAAIALRPEAVAIRAKTGLALDSTFSAPKLAWLFDADAALRGRAEAGDANAGNALGRLPALGLAADGATRAPDWSDPHPVLVPAPGGPGHPPLAQRRPHHRAGSNQLDNVSRSRSGGTLAGVAHQIADALDAVDAAGSADVLRVGGGLSAHDTLLQAVADLSGLTLEVAADPEATARGIATLAAEATGLLEGIPGAPAIACRVHPLLDEGGRARERSRWEDALEVHVRVDA